MKLLDKQKDKNIAKEILRWKSKHYFYHKYVENIYKYLIEDGKKVLAIGCSDGDLLNSVKPKYGLGVDSSAKIIEIAKDKHPHLKFIVQNEEELVITGKFDYIILSDIIGSLNDIQLIFKKIKSLCEPETRIIINFYNFLWEPLIIIFEKLNLKREQSPQNWLSIKDIIKLFELEDFEVITSFRKLMLPKNIPVLKYIFNIIIANLPVINHLSLVNFVVARHSLKKSDELKVSILVPAKNEKGNIENAIKRTPEFGTHQEFIFIEGNSTDNTYNEMMRVRAKYKNKDIKVFKQSGKGKGNAVREGFEKASGDVLMILDADLTVPPEDLCKFYEAIISNKGEFINGCRLVYPMEKQAMRLLNMMANKFFGLLFSYILGQNLKDTLCGTKVLYKKDYEKIKKLKHYFGDFDPFGDFELLFGASKLNLKIVEIPVRYKERQYGTTQIKRFSHGLLLFKMSFFALKKMKFI